MSGYISAALSELQSPDQIKRNAAALLLMDDPIIASANIPLSPQNQPRISIDQVGRAMNELASKGEMAYYEYLVNNLGNSNDKVFNNVYSYLSNDSRVNKEILQKATNFGRNRIDASAGEILRQSIMQVLQGEADKMRRRQESGVYSTVLPNNKVIIPGEELGALTLYKGGQVSLRQPVQAFSAIVKEIVELPDVYNDQVIEYNSREISRAVARTDNSTTMQLYFSQEQLASTLKLLRNVAPLVGYAREGNEEVARIIGTIASNLENQQISLAFTNMTDLCGRLTNSTYSAIKSALEYKQESEMADNKALSLFNEGNAIISQASMEIRNKNQEIELYKSQIYNQSAELQQIQNEKEEQVNKFKAYAKELALQASGTIMQTKQEAEAQIKYLEQEKEEVVQKFNTISKAEQRKQLTIQNLEQNLRDLNMEVDEAKRVLSTLIEVKGTLAEGISTLISKGNTIENERNKLSNEVSKLNATNQNNEKELEELKAKNEQQITLLRQRYEESQANTTTINELRAQLEQVNRTNALNNDLLETANRNKEEAVRQISELRAEMNRLKGTSAGEREGLQSKIDVYKAEYENAQDEIKRLNNELSKINAGANKLQSEISRYESDKNTLLLQLETAQKEYENINSIKTSMETALSLSRQNLNAKDVLISENKERISQLTLSLNNANELALTAEKVAKESSREAESKIKSIEAKYERQIKLKDTELAKIQKERDKYFNDLQSAQRELDEKMEVEDNMEPLDSLIANQTNPPPIPLEIANEICSIAMDQGKIPMTQRRVQRAEALVESNVKVSVQPPKIGAKPKVKIAPPKKKVKTATKALRKRAVQQRAKGYTITNRAKSSSRMRNTSKGGYVVGGRPDPLISPRGQAFWRNVYATNYHLF